MVAALRAKGLPVAYMPLRAKGMASARRRTSAAPWRPSCLSTQVFGFELAERGRAGGRLRICERL